MQRKREPRGAEGRCGGGEGVGGLSPLVHAGELEGPAARQVRFIPVGGKRVWRVLGRRVRSALQGTWLVNDGFQAARPEAGRWVKRPRKRSGEK